MKAITTIFLISILNSSQPQIVVLETTEVAMSEIKKKKKKARKLRRKARRKRKDSFQNSKVLNNMPAIKKQPKKVKKSDNTSENLNKAVTFLLDELDTIRAKVDKMAGRMGL